MAKVVYTGVSGKARKCKALYVGVSNKARKIKKGYVGVSNKARLFYTSDIIYTWQKWSINTTTTYSQSSETYSTNQLPATKKYWYFGVYFQNGEWTQLGNNFYDTAYNPIGAGANRDSYYMYDNISGNYCYGFTSSMSPGIANGRKIIRWTGRSASGGLYVAYISTMIISTSYSKGSTYYGTVTAANNPNAYPTNGVSGSYWYVRV